MKHKFLSGILFFILLGLFTAKAQAQIISVDSPQGDQNLHDILFEAVGSLDLIKVKEKGPSFVGSKQTPKASLNLGILLSIGIFPKIGGSFENKINGKSYLIPKSPYLETASIDSSSDLSARDRFPMKKKSGGFYITTGLEYVEKHTSETQGGSPLGINLNYIELPATLNYGFPVNRFSSVHFGFGPYFAYGISGSFIGLNQEFIGLNQEPSQNTVGQKTPIHFGSDPNVDDYKRTDFGLLINAGYLLTRHWNITAQYDFGIKNISATAPDPDSHLGGFSINLGYRF